MKKPFWILDLLPGAMACALMAPAAVANGVVLSSFVFTATVANDPNDPFAGVSGTGEVFYNSALVLDTWSPNSDPAFALNFTLFKDTPFEQAFHESNDMDFNLYPEVGIKDGVPQWIDFRVSEVEGRTTAITAPGVYNFWVVGDFIASDDVGGGLGSLSGAIRAFDVGPLASDPTYQVPLQINVVVPEVSGVAFAIVAGLGLGGLVFHRRRHRKHLC